MSNSKNRRSLLQQLSVSAVKEPEAQKSQEQPSEEASVAEPRNDGSVLSTMIRRTGEARDDQLRELRERLARYEVLEQQGGVVLDLPVSAVERNPLAMRSEAYFHTDDYFRIRDSIGEHGQREPVLVRPLSHQDDRYQIINGDTRLRAHRDLDRATIRARVQEMDDLQAVVATVIENRDRQNPPPYDNAIYHARILTDIYRDDRSALIKDLGYTKGWLSQQLTIAAIPMALIEAFPALYQAPSRSLYELGQILKDDPPGLPALLEDPPSLQTASGQAQVRKLLRYLQGRHQTAKSTAVAKNKDQQLFQDSSGRIRVGRKLRTKGGAILDFGRGGEAFADYVMAQLPELLERYRRERDDDLSL